MRLASSLPSRSFVEVAAEDRTIAGPPTASAFIVDQGALLLTEGTRYTLLAALVVAIGSCIRGQVLLTVGLPVTVAGLAIAIHAMARLQRRQDDVHESRTLIVGALLLASAVGFVAPTVGGPVYDALKRGYYLAGCLAVWAWAYGPPRHRSRIVLAMAAAFCALQIATPLVVPDPFIDSWAWTQSCLRALAQGIHPYTVRPADIIHGAFYSVGSAPRYPYMPATLLIYFPAYVVLGDYRFVLGVCGPLTLWMMRSIARRLHVADATIDVALLAVLLHPRSFTMVGFGWTEPLLATVLATFVLFSVRRPGGIGQAVSMLCLPALKQYALVPVLWFLWTRRRAALKTLACAVVVLATSALPFLLWNAPATLDGITSEMSGATHPSLRSTSIVASLFTITGHFPTRWLAALMQLAVGAYAHQRLRHAGLGGLLLGSGLALLTTFLTAWQAFVNYFYVVAICLALAALVLSARDERGQPQPVTSY